MLTPAVALAPSIHDVPVRAVPASSPASAVRLAAADMLGHKAANGFGIDVSCGVHGSVLRNRNYSPPSSLADASTIAVIPARTASGSVFHASITLTRSGCFSTKSAKRCAKTVSDRSCP